MKAKYLIKYASIADRLAKAIQIFKDANIKAEIMNKKIKSWSAPLEEIHQKRQKIRQENKIININERRNIKATASI